MLSNREKYSFSLKHFGGIALAVVVFCSLLLVGCKNESLHVSNNVYQHISNNVSNYTQQKYALASGSSYTFNLKEIFVDSGLEIVKYVIESGEDKNYTVKGETITARGTGVSSLDVTLYVPSKETMYVCSLGTLYSYDEKDFTSISTAEELQNMTLDGRYILRSDIDLAGMEWEPVGNYPDGNQFVGMMINPYDYKIENLTISSSDNVFHGPLGGCAGGLFGSLKNAFIFGLCLENVSIDVSDFQGKSFSSAGGVANSVLDSYIKDCSVSGNITAVGNAGGIVGSLSWGYVENCKFSGLVETKENLQDYAMESGDTGAGGIAGYCGCPQGIDKYRLAIIGCEASGSITAVKNAGGIAGCINGKDSVKGCTFKGETFGQNTGDDFGNIRDYL